MALRFLHRDMVIPIVLFWLRTQRLPLRAVSSHATSFLSFCIFSYIIPRHVKGYFYDLPSFFHFFIKFLYPTTPFYPIGRTFASSHPVILKSQGVTEGSGGRGEPAIRIQRQQVRTLYLTPPRMLHSSLTNSA